MSDYQEPTQSGECGFVEKRSRFIAHVFRVETEDEARARISEMKALHHDARHNCWCFILKETGAERYSDDGEPQGTAGQPMLEVFRRENVTNVCCVVTRYFGGILLGAGGLTRAYARSAKDGLDAAGISVVRPWTQMTFPCPYHFLERVKLEVEGVGGVCKDAAYAADVTLRVLLPADSVDCFTAKLTELTAGGVTPKVTGGAFVATPQILDKS